MSAQHAPNFDRVARIYHWAEYLAMGPLLQRTRTHLLPALQDRRSAFVLGDGDGRFLAKLLRQNSQLRATAVDTSGKMLALLQHRCAFAGHRLQTLQASALEATIPPATDLIVTHFFLDCLTQAEVETLTHTIATSCRPGTRWLVSDFQIPTQGWKKTTAALYIRLLYLAFRWLTRLRVQALPEHRSLLRAAGFKRISYHESLGGMLYTELWKREAEL